MRAIFVAISIFSRCFETISDIESPPNREESDLTGLKQEDGYNNTWAEHHLQRNRGRPNYLTGNVWHLALWALGSALKKKAFDDKHL